MVMTYTSSLWKWTRKAILKLIFIHIIKACLPVIRNSLALNQENSLAHEGKVMDIISKKIVFGITANIPLTVGTPYTYEINIKFTELSVRELYLLSFYQDEKIWDNDVYLTKYKHEIYSNVRISPGVAGGGDTMGDVGFFEITTSPVLSKSHQILRLRSDFLYDFFENPILVSSSDTLRLQCTVHVSNYVPVGSLFYQPYFYFDVGIIFY